MGTTRIRASTTVAPERFVEALTDFGERRSELWGNSAGSYLQVHDRGATWADVTEGSAAGGGIWQRYRYDWSKPDVVRLDVLASNTFGPGSWWEYRITPQASGGGSRVDLTVHRAPTTAKARILDLVLAAYGRRFLGRDLRRTLRRLETAAA
jgi:hypothetical protein